MNFSSLKGAAINWYYPVIFYFSISFLILFYFKGHYILTLDMVFPIKPFFTNYFYGFSPPVFGGDVLVAHSTQLLPAWLLQRLYLFLVIFLSGISMHYSVGTKSSIPRYFAGILYAVNPFVYVRFLAGHLLILLAYSLMPFAVKSFLDFLANQDKKNLVKLSLLTALIGALNSHILALLFLVYLVFLGFKLYQVKNEIYILKNFLISFAVFAILYLLLSLYWLLPLFTAKATLMHQISQSDIYIFATEISAFNAVFTVASMYGFWRCGYIYAKDFIPYWYLLFFFILFLAVHGFISNYRSKTFNLPVKALGVIAIISVVLGSGVYGPFSSLFEFLFNNVFFFKGLRDSHKFAALIALSYSYLGALGVAEFEKIIHSPASGTGAYEKYKKIAACIIIAMALIVPFIYSFTIFNSFWGQLEPTDYPGDWYEVNELLNRDPQDYNVLFLPWHHYMDFKWIPNSQKRIANPASSFFDKPVIQGENFEIGLIYTQSTNPEQRYVESLLRNRDKIVNFGELVIPLNIKYVLLTKEVEYKEYFFLFNQTDIELIKETENFYIFKNNHPVSRVYLSSSLPSSDPENQSGSILSLKPSDYTKISPVEFSVREEAGYIIFVPPNLDAEYWELDRQPSIANGLYAVYPAKEGTIYYRRFDTYLVGYLVSLVTLIGLVVWYRK